MTTTRAKCCLSFIVFRTTSAAILWRHIGKTHVWPRLSHWHKHNPGPCKNRKICFERQYFVLKGTKMYWKETFFCLKVINLWRKVKISFWKVCLALQEFFFLKEVGFFFLHLWATVCFPFCLCLCVYVSVCLHVSSTVLFAVNVHQLVFASVGASNWNRFHYIL